MDPGTLFAIFGFADQCTKYGGKLVKACQAYRHAPDEMQDLLVIIQHQWAKIHAQIQVLREVSNSLPSSFNSYFSSLSQVLSRLEGKLKTALLTLEQISRSQWSTEDHSEQAFIDRMGAFMDMSSSAKARYAFRQSSLQAIIDDIEKWQQRFDPSWMLIMRSNIQPIDQVLSDPSRQHSIIRTAKEMRRAVRLRVEDVPLHSCWLDVAQFNCSSPVSSLAPLALIGVKGSQENVLIDTMHCLPMVDVTRLTKDVCKLAHVLSKVDPSAFGLLQCEGVIRASETIHDARGKVKQTPIFSFVFKVPSEWIAPQSLRSVLLEAADYPLNQRLDLARALTQSILFLHSISVVHKNIRPEIVATFQNAESNVATAFLVGFERFRPEDGQTYMVGTEEFARNLYQHPSRQGVLPEETYRMQHDIYSLGVILLEIGLWTSLVFTRHDEAQLHPELGLFSPSDEPHPTRRARHNKKVLEKLASARLPILMGQRYSHAVLACLTCLDEEVGAGFGVIREGPASLLDENGLIIGSRFIEYVLDKVQEISV